MMMGSTDDDGQHTDDGQHRQRVALTTMGNTDDGAAPTTGITDGGQHTDDGQH